MLYIGRKVYYFGLSVTTSRFWRTGVFLLIEDMRKRRFSSLTGDLEVLMRQFRIRDRHTLYSYVPSGSLSISPSSLLPSSSGWNKSGGRGFWNWILSQRRFPDLPFPPRPSFPYRLFSNKAEVNGEEKAHISSPYPLFSFSMLIGRFQKEKKTPLRPTFFIGKILYCTESIK